MKTFFNILTIFLILSSSAVAEEILTVTPDVKEYDLTASMLLCIDTLDTVSAQMLMQEENPPMCRSVGPEGLPYGYTDSTIWLRSTLYSTASAKKEWIVELNSPLLDYVDLYVVQDGRTVSHFQSGDRRPFSSRPIASRDFRFPLTLVPGTKTTLIWKIRSDTAVNLPITLQDKELLQEKDLKAFLYYGIFYGILIILAVYNFIFFLIFQKNIYLYYVGFIVFYALMQLSFDGLAPLLLWPDLPWLYNDGVPFFVNLAILSAVLFGQRFLETSLYAPKIHTVLNIVLAINVLAMLLCFFNVYSITVMLTTLLAVVTPLLLMTAGVAVLNKIRRRAEFYLWAWSFFFAGSSLLALHKLGILPSSWIMIHAQQIGVLFKIMVLSYALGDQLQSLLYVDQLTGVGNRRSLDRIFASAVRYAQKDKLPFAVLTIDLDDFKTINDSMTHKAGDKLLMLLTRRLKSYLRRYDTILRMGQDEFLIILERIETTEDLTHIADKILVQVRKPFTLNGRIIHTTASMGIALYPNDGEDYDTLIKNSDSALHKAKELGKNRFHYFNPVLDNTAVERLKLYNDLFRALENQEFFLLYQPKISAKDNTLAGVEVLIRWDHPERGVLAPDHFIGIAEQSDLILRITKWVLESTFERIKRWQTMGWDNIYAAVNITAKDLKDTYFIRDLMDLFKQYRLGTDALELELTERVIVEECSDSIHKLSALHDAGINIAIDDFGTGYSTFSYLRSYHVHTIKIDKSFVDEIEHNPKTAKIVNAMTSLGHELGMRVVVEGVETERQVQMLKQMHCDIFQGYYFDRPLTAEELTAKYFRQ